MRKNTKNSVKIYVGKFDNRVTITLSCVITKKNLYLNLLVTSQILLFLILSFTRSLIVSYLEMDGKFSVY